MSFWGIILLSGITAAIVSGFMSLWLKKLEYRHQYYHEIIRRRLKVYEYLDHNILNTLNAYSPFGDPEGIEPLDGQFCHDVLAHGFKVAEDFTKHIRHVLENRIWLGEKTAKLLITLHDRISGILFVAQQIGNNEKPILLEIAHSGVTGFNDLRDQQKKIENSVKNDLKTFPNVRRHFSEERTLS